MAKYRKKPVVIDAIQYIPGRFDPTGFFGSFHDWAISVKGVSITTLEGTMIAEPNDYIIKGIKGEFYPCKPDIFAQTYEKVED